MPAEDLVDPLTQAFLPEAELRARLERVGALASDRVITYCGGGIAASSVAFALALLGHDGVAVYDASLEEWATDPSLPIETG
jgi:thiosulfate/3-mercaptopyruvate sulfurtransferase